MSMELFLFPNFERLKPQYIERCVYELQRASHDLEGNIENRAKERYETIIEKINRREPLLKKDYLVLAFCLSRLESEGYLNIFYKLFRKSIKSFNGVSSFVRPFASYIYNNGLNENTRKIYNLFRRIRPKLPDKPRNGVISQLLLYNKDLADFLEEIKINIQSKESIVDIGKYCHNIFMKDSDKAYCHYIIDFIVSNHKKRELWPEFRRMVEVMDFEDKKKVFAGILRCYIDNYEIESYPRNWFEFIGMELREPNDQYNKRWDGMDEEKDVFRRWLAYSNVQDFFVNKIKGGDRRRCNFWLQYVDCMYRVKHYRDANMALVMEFKHHIIVEFAQQSNACYVYSKEHLTIEEIEEKLKPGVLTSTEKINFLKNQSLRMTRLLHRGNWEYDFTAYLHRLGYRKERRAHWDSF